MYLKYSWLTWWNPIWSEFDQEWQPIDLYDSLCKSNDLNIHSNEIGWRILGPPSFHSLHNGNSALPSVSYDLRKKNCDERYKNE